MEPQNAVLSQSATLYIKHKGYWNGHTKKLCKIRNTEEPVRTSIFGRSLSHQFAENAVACLLECLRHDNGRPHTAGCTVKQIRKVQDTQSAYTESYSEACSGKHCRYGGGTSITYSECVCVALVIQHSQSMCRIILLPVRLHHIFLNISYTALFSWGGELLNTKCVFYLYNFYLKIFSF